MSSSTDKFTGLADIYSKHRPGYPAKSIEFVINTCGLNNGSTIADIGSGTGIATRLFAKAGIGKVIAVEPNSDMRQVSQIQSKKSGITNDIIEFVDATAESTGLSSESLDTVISAQAFHWFDAEPALAEFSRILKPEGFCVLIWNVRDEVDSFTKDYGDLMHKHSESVSDEVKRGVSGKKLLLSNLFQSKAVSEFANKQKLDLKGLLGRAISTSYAPRGKAASENLQEELKELFGKFSKSNLVTLKYTTSVYISQRKVSD